MPKPSEVDLAAESPDNVMKKESKPFRPFSMSFRANCRCCPPGGMMGAAFINWSNGLGFGVEDLVAISYWPPLADLGSMALLAAAYLLWWWRSRR